MAGAVFGEVGVWVFVAGAAFGDILGDSRSAKCCIFQYKIVSKIGRVRSPKRRVRDDDFIVGSSSDHPRIILGSVRIVFLLAEAIHGVSAESLNLQISWQAQYLVRLEADCACSAHCKWRFICDVDQSWDSFCVAGAVFGEVGVWVFVAGAAFGDILGDSRSAKCCIFQYKIVSKIGRVRSPKRRVRDDDFIVGSSSDHPRIILGSVRIVFLLAEAIHGVSAESLNLQISWQAQYLVRLEADCACSAHCKWRFICDVDQSWDSFCVAGAVFGEVGVWVFVAGAAFGDILGDSRSAKCCIFQYKIVSKIGRVRSPKRRVRDDDFIVGSSSDHPRIILGSVRIVFLLAEAIHGVSAESLNLQISWQAQYLVRLEADCACSAHCKWRFICDVDQSWDSFCEAGAVFGEVGVWVFVAGAAFGDILGDSRSAKCCIFQYKIVSKIGRVRSPKRRVRDDDFIVGSSSDHLRIILGSVRIVFLLAEAIHGVSAESLNLQISWQAQYLVRLEADCACSAHCKWRFICEADQSWGPFCVEGAVFGEGGGWLLLLRAF